MPADILGQVYEQFLGKVIRLTDGHQAKVEDKPEVKKAGGVFYTPTYIVDYIVQADRWPAHRGQDAKADRKSHACSIPPAVLAPSSSVPINSCWTGITIITRLTTRKPRQREEPQTRRRHGGGWALTTTERKRILLAHIYGVDIDSQAVEVTKLSLLFKVLEGETAQTVQRELIHERVLPDLGNNIKCGNSLIGSDFYAQPGLPEMDAEAHLSINVFDWDGKDGFPRS
jgi:hypothetical protein